MSTQVETKNAVAAPSKGSSSAASAGSGKDSLSMMSSGPLAIAMLEVYAILGNELKIANADATQKNMSIKMQSDECKIAATSIEDAGYWSAAQMFTQAGTSVGGVLIGAGVSSLTQRGAYSEASEKLTDNETRAATLTTLQNDVSKAPANTSIATNAAALKMTPATAQKLADGELLEDSKTAKATTKDDLVALRDRSLMKTRNTDQDDFYKKAYASAQDRVSQQKSDAISKMRTYGDQISDISNSRRTYHDLATQFTNAAGNTGAGFEKITETKNTATTELSRTGGSMASQGVQDFNNQMSKQFDFAAQALKVLEAIESSTKGN